ncbi:MAG: DUF883 C-terminal domain-containing protein [Bacteroidota bacterium]
MAETRSTQELRAVLEAKEASIKHHIAGLESELTFNDVMVGGRPLTDYVREQPLLAVGVAAGVGLAAGLIGGLLARSAPEGPSEHDLWMGAYLRDLVDDAGMRVAEGEAANAALGKALRRRAPVVVVEPEPTPVRTKTASSLNVLMNTALGFGAKFVLDQMARQLTGDDGIVNALQDMPDAPPTT